MHETVPELAVLERMSMAELRLKYLEVYGEPTAAHHRRWLIRRIAWRMQALAEGDLSQRARKRAEELARDADLRNTAPRPPRTRPAIPKPRPAIATQGRDPRLPPLGESIARSYKGRLVEVQLVAEGFAYEGAIYKSLSAVARIVTGAHCNGFLFFGLVASRRSP